LIFFFPFSSFLSCSGEREVFRSSFLWLVIPAKAGIQFLWLPLVSSLFVIPAKAGIQRLGLSCRH